MQTAPRPTPPAGLPQPAVLAVAIAAAAAGPVPALATAEVECAAIGREALQVDLTAAPSDIRHIVLRLGETLRFTFEAAPGPTGTLRLIEGAEAPRQLLAGPSGTVGSFTAPSSGIFGFQFVKDGKVAGRFTVTCGPPEATPGGRASKQDPASEAGDPPLGTGDVTADGLQIEALDAPDFGALATKQAPAGREGITDVPKSGTGAELKLHWLDQRYRSSGLGMPQIDPSASGVEIGLNYKLQSALIIGALAQVNPAAEMLLGGQRTLVDQGWMAGPFTTLQIAPGLVLDARAAWGEGGTGPDEAVATAAQRRLISARLANQLAFGPWRLTPSVNLNYLHEDATAGGRIDMGPELAYRTDLSSSAFIEPRIVVGGFWDFDALAKEGSGAPTHAEMRLKAEAGLTIGLYDGPKLQALGALEEGDRETPDAWSGRLQLSVPLK